MQQNQYSSFLKLLLLQLAFELFVATLELVEKSCENNDCFGEDNQAKEEFLTAKHVSKACKGTEFNFKIILHRHLGRADKAVSGSRKLCFQIS